jgi:hypothetical protein
MKIVPIFDESKYTLLAVQYDGEEEDEFTKAFNQWNDVKFLRQFFREHEADLLYGFYKWENVNRAVDHTRFLAQKLEDLIYEKADEQASEIPNMLQSIFKPLNNNETDVQALQKSKTSYQWLRLYAIRINQQCYIITGSAIKLVLNMDERKYLQDELRKLEQVKNYLKEEGIADEFDYLEL